MWEKKNLENGPWPEWEGGMGRVSSRAQTTPPHSIPNQKSSGSRGAAPSWSPLSPRLGSLSQISGTNKSKKQLRGDQEGLQGCAPSGC